MGLLAQLNDKETDRRRWAARDLARHPEATTELAARLAVETAPAVRDALLSSLLAIASDEVVESIVPFLRSEDAGLRNGVVAVLQRLPEPVARHMTELLADPDPDVRILSIDILQDLAHPQALVWLREALENETAVNVVGAAIDRLAQIGTPDLAPLLDVRERFCDEPYIRFAVDMVLKRLDDASQAGPAA